MSQPPQRTTPVVPLARAPLPLGAPPDAYRVQALHACQVLAGLLMRVPRPESVQLFTAPHWSAPWLQVHLHPDPDDAQLAEYQRAFGGDLTRRWRDGAEPGPDGGERAVVYSELATVVDRVRVQIWNVNDVPAPLRPADPAPPDLTAADPAPSDAAPSDAAVADAAVSDAAVSDPAGTPVERPDAELDAEEEPEPQPGEPEPPDAEVGVPVPVTVSVPAQGGSAE